MYGTHPLWTYDVESNLGTTLLLGPVPSFVDPTVPFVANCDYLVEEQGQEATRRQMLFCWLLFSFCFVLF